MNRRMRPRNNHAQEETSISYIASVQTRTRTKPNYQRVQQKTESKTTQNKITLDPHTKIFFPKNWKFFWSISVHHLCVDRMESIHTHRDELLKNFHPFLMGLTQRISELCTNSRSRCSRQDQPIDLFPPVLIQNSHVPVFLCITNFQSNMLENTSHSSHGWFAGATLLTCIAARLECQLGISFSFVH